MDPVLDSVYQVDNEDFSFSGRQSILSPIYISAIFFSVRVRARLRLARVRVKVTEG